MAAENQPHDPSHGPKVTPVHVGGDSLLDRLVPYLKQIAVALIALAVVLTGFFTWRWWKARGEAEGTRHLAVALELGERPIIPVDLDDKLPEHFKTQTDRANAVLAELAKAGDARSTAPLYEAQMLFQAGKVDDALSRYRALTGRPGVEGALAREGVAVLLESKASETKDPAQRQQQLEAALTAFRAVQTDDKGPRRDYALYHEGRLLELLGKNTEAIAPLQKALVVAPETPLRSAIELRLSALGAAEGS